MLKAYLSLQGQIYHASQVFIGLGRRYRPKAGIEGGAFVIEKIAQYDGIREIMIENLVEFEGLRDKMEAAYISGDKDLALKLSQELDIHIVEQQRRILDVKNV